MKDLYLTVVYDYEMMNGEVKYTYVIFYTNDNKTHFIERVEVSKSTYSLFIDDCIKTALQFLDKCKEDFKTIHVSDSLINIQAKYI